MSVLCLAALLLSACSATHREAVQSLYTGLGAGVCKKEIDRSDPNETPYLACPGVAGYSLIVRRVDAGRQSIDVVDATQRVFPLNYHEFVTRHMSNLVGRAEWRVAVRDGRQVPIGLIVRVQAREDLDNPEKVTRTYLAVAKLAPNQSCVTAIIPEGSQSEADARRAADSAQASQCAPPQPPMTEGGVVIR